jgi:hypothetical protein
MRRAILCGILAVAAATSSSGCFINQYSPDPVRRYRQLFNQSEDFRAIEDEIERFWMLDQPSALTLKRGHGYADPAPRRRFR